MEATIKVGAVLFLSLIFSLLFAVPGALVLTWLADAVQQVVPTVPDVSYAQAYPIVLFTFWLWNLLTTNTAGGGSE